nr:unnamed protein product [Callosobruchus chinensis]
MSFRSRIDHVCEKQNRAYYAIFQLKSCLSQDAFMTVYDEYIAICHIISFVGANPPDIFVFLELRREFCP